MDGARLPVWLIALALLFWGAVVAWRWTAGRPEWRSVTSLSLLAYLVMLGLQLRLPASSDSNAASILLAVGCGTAALAIGANAPRMLLGAWLFITLTATGALLALGDAAGAALMLVLSAGGFFPWWGQCADGGDTAGPSGAEQVSDPPPAPAATLAALASLTLGVWGAVHSAAIHEAGMVSPGGQHSALPRGIVSGSESPVFAATPQGASPWSGPELLGIVGMVLFVGMLGVTSDASSSASDDRQHVKPA